MNDDLAAAARLLTLTLVVGAAALLIARLSGEAQRAATDLARKVTT